VVAPTRATSDTAERPQGRFPKGFAWWTTQDDSRCPLRGPLSLVLSRTGWARLRCAPRISRAQLYTETGRQRLRATLVEPGRLGRLPHRPCGRPCRGRPCECAPAIRRGSRLAAGTAKKPRCVPFGDYRPWPSAGRAGTREAETRLTRDYEIGSNACRDSSPLGRPRPAGPPSRHGVRGWP
jgi:hypothetical protein